MIAWSLLRHFKNTWAAFLTGEFTYSKEISQALAFSISRHDTPFGPHLRCCEMESDGTAPLDPL